MDISLGAAVRVKNVFRIPGCEHHFEVWPAIPGATSDLDAAQAARKHDIGEHKINVLVLFNDL
jgi:hypothetical protein